MANLTRSSINRLVKYESSTRPLNEQETRQIKEDRTEKRRKREEDEEKEREREKARRVTGERSENDTLVSI